MQKYDSAVLLIGSPNLTFQAAASAASRLLESFEIDKLSAFYSGFAEEEASKIVRFMKMFFDKDMELTKLPTDLREAVTVLEQVLKQGKAIAVPTPGSLLGAVSLTLAAAKTGSDIGHVLFPSGLGPVCFTLTCLGTCNPCRCSATIQLRDYVFSTGIRLWRTWTAKQEP